MKHSILFLFIATLILGSFSLALAGPFGLEGGMTKRDLYKLVGKDTIKVEKGDLWKTYELQKVPKPHSLFKRYSVLICPKRGIVRLLVFSKLIETSVYGDELKSQFEMIRNAVSGKYGKGKIFDYLKRGSIWNQPREWMTSLEKRERVLSTYWGTENNSRLLKDRIVGVVLHAWALDSDVGVLELKYEFEGFVDFVAEAKKRQNQIF